MSLFSIEFPIFQAFIAACFTWLITLFGAAMIFIFRSVGKKVLDGMLGFAGGIMIAASYWSLLNPAIEMSKKTPVWFQVAVGFLLGGFFLWSIDKILPHLHIGFPIEEAEGIKTGWQRATLLTLAITLHNIPEGLVVGAAFGTASLGLSTLSEAIALTIGIGVQNFPEGFAVSISLRRENFSRLKSFWYGQLSGVVEPLASIIGAIATTGLQSLLPYVLSFAAGAMMFIVIEEVIPESQRSGNTDLATVSIMVGFTIMMLLEIIFS